MEVYKHVFLIGLSIYYCLLLPVLGLEYCEDSCDGIKNGIPPNIIFIVADDLGWNDISLNNPNVKTPNIEKLAQGGTILTNYYVQPMCTPSRSAFLTGYYPFRTGLQHYVIKPLNGYGLPTKFKLLPQELKIKRYKTHLIGKWHLGFCKWGYTPTYRGFDSFYGFYNGEEDYYTHALSISKLNASGIDFRDNELPVEDKNRTHSIFLHTERAEKIIKSHNKLSPLFMSLWFQNVHGPLEVPKRFEDIYADVTDKRRRLYLGLVSALDEAVGNITRVLNDKGLMGNTVLIFTSDNGGFPNQGGNNFPFRGAKSTLWEGGTKALGIIKGENFYKREYSNLMHAIDWFPTILEMANIKPIQKVDGVSHWKQLKSGNHNLKEPRSEIVYNIDSTLKNGAIRVGNYKLIVGLPGLLNDWYYPGNYSNIPSNIKEEADINYYDKFEVEPRKNDRCLYDISKDPYEKNDLAEKMSEKVDELYERFLYYKEMEVQPFPTHDVLEGNPSNFGGFWSPGWC